MKAKLAILAGIALLSVLLVALDYRHGLRPPPEAPVAGEPAPPLVLPLLSEENDENDENDAMLRLADWRGRYVLLNVWASWCAPCLKEFPDLLELAAAHPDRLALLTISVDAQREAAQRFLRRVTAAAPPQANIRHGWDEGKRLTQNALHVYRYPESILIDPQGRMIRKYAGALSEQNLAQIRRILRRAP